MALLTNMLLGEEGNLKQFDKNAVELSFTDNYIGSIDSNLAGGLLKSMSRKIRTRISLRRDFLTYAEMNKLVSIANDMSAFKLLKIDDALEIIDEQRYSLNVVTVKLQNSSREWITPMGVWLKTDPHHEGTNYYNPYWDVKYEADALPQNSSPAWTKDGIGEYTEEIADGKLHCIATAGNIITYYRDESGISNAIGTTLEARVKMGDCDQRLRFSIDDGTQLADLVIYNNRIYLAGLTENIYYINMTDDYHIIRLTLKGNDRKVYLDNKLIISGTYSYMTALHNICFGKPTNLLNLEFYCDWLYYRIDGAFPPYFDPDTKTVTLTNSLPSANEEVLVNYKYCGWRVDIMGCPVRLSPSGLFWMLDMNLEGV